jgi:NAD(P)-dependent dehydrogenase (short-subunit alcohol dehydrogenase family)
MMARALAVNGAKKVYIIGRREEKLKEVAASVDTKNIIPIVGDVTSKDSLAAAAAQVQAETGYINVLIANSGTNGPSNRPNPEGPLEEFQKLAWEVGFDEYNDTFKLNVTATWFTIIAFLGLLDEGNKRAKRGEGEGPNVKSQVIAVSSVAAASRIIPVGAWYGQSKAAVTHLVKQLATGFVGYGIRVNAIAPGCKL